MLHHHDARDYDAAVSEAAKYMRPKTEEVIAKGEQSGEAMVQHVLGNVPQDYVPRGRKLKFHMDDACEKPMVWIDTAANAVIHRYALGQVAAKAKIPMDYLGRLLDGDKPWMRELAIANLNEHYQKVDDLSGNKHLVRVVNGTVKGFLSPRFRRLDSRPLLEAFIEICKAYGMVPIEGTICETHYKVKVAFPFVFEPVPNEVMMFYAEWGNSDFGAAKHTCSFGVWRLWCTNKATMNEALSSIHLGRELADSVELSQKTYELDTATEISALKDIVKLGLAPEKVKSLLAGIKTAHEKGIEWKDVKSKLQKALLVGEMKAAQEAFDSDDDVNLPPAHSLWRASNALSFIAKKVDDPSRRLQLERIAGKLVSGEKIGDAVEEAA